MTDPLLLLLPAAPFTLAYEGEQTENDPPPDPTPVTPPPPTPETPPARREATKVKFDQAQQDYINSLLAEERRKARDKNDQLITQLETQKNLASTTAAERATLEARIESLHGEFNTKEQLRQHETTKRLNDLEKKAREREKEASEWRARFYEKTLQVDLTQAAVAGESYNTETVVTVLRQHARPVEEVGPDGKPTGNLITRVKLQGKGEDGKPVQLDLSPAEAIKIMKEDEQHHNLFISRASGGLGAGNLNRTPTGAPDISKMTTAQYIAHRDAEKKKGGNRRP